MKTMAGLRSRTMEMRQKSELLVGFLLAVLIVLLLLFPLFINNEYYLRVANNILTYAMLALGLNVVLGFAGVFHFGQAAMFAIGAYTTALLTTRYGLSFPLAFVASALLPVLASLLLGFPSLRIRGDYLALVTFAFGEIVRIVANGWVDFTRGPMGIPGIPSPNIFGLVIRGNTQFYYFGLFLTIVVYLGCYLVTKSHFGRAFLAIREDETAASMMGINTGRYKILAFMISAIPAGIAGSYMATYLSFVGPTSFSADASILVVEMVILGGMASFPGSILGSVILVTALEVLRSIAQFRKAFIGITIILLLIYRPQGLLSNFDLVGLLDRLRKKPKPANSTNGNSLSLETRAPEVKRWTAPEEKKLLIRGTRVSKNFGGVRALQSLDFELFVGEILGLIGPNGSGKTTLFNVISGIYPATSGEILLENRRINNLPSHQIVRQGLQRTFQNVRLFKRLPVLTNVMIGAHVNAAMSMLPTMARSGGFRAREKEVKEQAMYWLSFVGIQHRAKEQARNLPYGEQKLLEIARALASNPKVLLLDEPAAGLNPSEVEALAAVVRKIRAMGITVFVVEHNMRLMMDICDRIIVINFGQKVAEGSPSEIQMNPDVQSAYLGTA